MTDRAYIGNLRRQRRAHRVLLAVALGLVLSAAPLAQDAPYDPRITPRDCEKWEARTRALANSDDPVEEQLGELLLRPELSFCQTRRVPVRDATSDEPSEPDWMPDLTRIAGLMQWVAVGTLIALLAWLLTRLQPGRWRADRAPRKGKAIPEDLTRDLLDPSTDELDQVLDGAEQAWKNGDRRRALSLLYRGALVRIWPDPRDNRARTEREVLSELRQPQFSDELLSTMRSLTRLWQQSAWAHRMPSDSDFQTIRDRWATTFDRRGVKRP